MPQGQISGFRGFFILWSPAILSPDFLLILLFILLNNGSLEVWHLYITGFIASTADSFQFPAFSAAVTMMIEKACQRHA